MMSGGEIQGEGWANRYEFWKYVLYYATVAIICVNSILQLKEL
jgi:hypothetical protein